MDDGARRTYQRMADLFLLTGGIFLLLGLARVTVAPELLNGNPLPVALLLLAIGGALRWTARPRE